MAELTAPAGIAVTDLKSRLRAILDGAAIARPWRSGRLFPNSGQSDYKKRKSRRYHYAIDLLAGGMLLTMAWLLFNDRRPSDVAAGN